MPLDAGEYRDFVFDVGGLKDAAINAPLTCMPLLD